MKKTMKKPKKSPKDINGENSYEEVEKGVPTPSPKPILSGDELLDAAFKALLKFEKGKH